MKEQEHYIQETCVRWFNMQFPQYRGLLFAVPNGGARSKATAGKMKAEGVVAGVADLILLKPMSHPAHDDPGWYNYFHGLCIEMKTPKGYQSASQKEWQAKVEEQGYQYSVCRSLNEFIATIKKYLKV